jgi:hypothetical protein
LSFDEHVGAGPVEGFVGVVDPVDPGFSFGID